jgi:hypothetical protein
LEACQASQHNNLRAELLAIKKSATTGISAGRTTSTNTGWALWTDFCLSLACDPLLDGIDDPLPLLQIFASRYRLGNLAPSGSPVKARTVESALRAVGQTLAVLGKPDPRLQQNGKLDLRLHRQLQSYSKADPPPSRVKPIPLQLLHHTINLCYSAPDPGAHALGNMLTLGFFFLLRPGEYAATENPDATPFRVCDIHLLRNNTRLDTYHCAELDLHAATHVALEFTKQKNGVRGELVGLGRSGHAILCPVSTMIQCVLHFRLHQAPPATPIYTYYMTNTPHKITTSMLTTQLRQSCLALGSAVGIHPSDISVRSLRSSGAMALLCADVDSERIRLLGRWKSDEMLRYLHVQALPIVAPLATLMVQHGHFSFIPNNRLG